MREILFICSLSAVLYLNFACHGGRRCGYGGGDEQCYGGQEYPVEGTYSPVQDIFGPEARAMPYDSRVFDSANGGPVTGPDQLRCDFDSSCCWQNNKPPLDKLDWSSIEGTVDPDRFSRAFGTASFPSGRFLAIVSGATDSSDEAQFHSCSIACTEEPVRVTIKHWTTEGVKLQVCTREAFFDNPENAPLLNCQELPRSSAPGPTTVELAPGEFFDVVIVAYNFVGALGAAAIDDIEVAFTPCQVTAEPSLAPAGESDECGKVLCDFEGSYCAYADLKSQGTASANWETVQGRFKNPLTGLNNAPSGSYYAATYLMPNEKSTLQVESELPEERVVRFQYYKATQGIQLIACCGPTANVCTFKTPIDVEVGDRVWKTGNMVCPAGSNQITFTALNQGANQGAVGLDDIKLYKSTGDPASATEVVC